MARRLHRAPPVESRPPTPAQLPPRSSGEVTPAGRSGHTAARLAAGPVRSVCHDVRRSFPDRRRVVRCGLAGADLGEGRPTPRSGSLSAPRTPTESSRSSSSACESADEAVPDAFLQEERAAKMANAIAPSVLARARDAYDGPMMLLKGPEVSILYPGRARMLADLDLLVDDAPAAREALLASGFESADRLEPCRRPSTTSTPSSCPECRSPSSSTSRSGGRTDFALRRTKSFSRLRFRRPSTCRVSSLPREPTMRCFSLSTLGPSVLSGASAI